ncbi:MAG: class I SAM-dependent methyltransferase [Pseudomonadota bacterium]
MKHISLVDEAHSAVSDVLAPGEKAIDATVGNGHDTLFLAKGVAPGGVVFGFDIQERAIANTRERIEAEHPHCQIILIKDDHVRMPEHIPLTDHGAVSAVMFNLGYLPGGCKSIITSGPSTLAALNAAYVMLRPGGILSVVAYTGHPGGREEADAVKKWALGVTPKRNLIQITIPQSARGTAPELVLVTKNG